MNLAIMENAMREILVPLFFYNVSFPLADVGFRRSLNSGDDASNDIEDDRECEEDDHGSSQSSIQHGDTSIALLSYECKQVTV